MLIYLRPQGISPISLMLTHIAQRNYAWQCTALAEPKKLSPSGSIVWTRLQCDGTHPIGFTLKSGRAMGPLIINIIDANLSDTHVMAKPTLAAINPNQPPLNKLTDMAEQQPVFVAGINGGYFRLKPNKGDVNCKERLPDIPFTIPQFIGDGLLVIDKQVFSTNCAGSAFSEPARSALIQDATTKQWRIEPVLPGKVPVNALNAIGAGPGLIQTINGKPQIRMTWEGIWSTMEFSANTAVILATDAQNQPHMLFFTVDGRDGKWGMTSMQMANFIYDKIPRLFHVRLVSAMSMDQGTSTTMFVKDATTPIVTTSNKYNEVHDIYNGLFVAYQA